MLFTSSGNGRETNVTLWGRHLLLSHLNYGNLLAEY
ncbi:hypothetical protein IFM89_022452 [Coptis chinensis]|uniref:Uncharacterized protein n=1 Tax=Coptis chinensis TaxID=261450 RepID=A0A835M180_9MAGN|nr:hypothetical protein IFM89_022452 [Coptis chinensis]